MYVSEWAIFRYKRLRYQLNRLKTQKGIDKYSKIEHYKNEFVTFRRFCDECEEYFSCVYVDGPTPYTIQEVFDYLS